MPWPAAFAWIANNPAMMALISKVGGNLLQAKQNQKKKKPNNFQQNAGNIDPQLLLEIMRRYKGGA